MFFSFVVMSIAQRIVYFHAISVNLNKSLLTFLFTAYYNMFIKHTIMKVGVKN